MVSSMATAANARWSKLLAISLCAAAAVAFGEERHEVWDRVVKKHVSTIGEVDYGALKSDRADLDAYVKWLGEVSKSASAFSLKSRRVGLLHQRV